MGIKRWRLGLIALVVIGLIAALWAWAGTRNERNAVTIKTARVERNTVTTSVSGTGILEPLTTVEVKSNVGGQLVYLGVDEGDAVEAGQVIARIDAADAESALEQSQADLESARAKVAQSRENLAMQRAQNTTQVQAAEQAVESARLKLAQAEKQAKLQVTTTDTGIEQARHALTSARAKLAQAEEQARIQPQLTDTSIAQAKSTLAAARTSYQQTKNALGPQKIAAAQSTLDQAKANYRYAETDLARQQQLLAKGFVARSQVDAAEQRFDVAKAQLTGAQQKVDTVKDEVRDDLDAAQAKVEQAEAALRTAEANRAQDSLKQRDVETARAAVKQAEATLRSAEANRVQNAVKDDDVAAARAALKQAQANLSTTKANAYQVAIRQGDITQANAQVKRTEASVANARTSLGYTTIAAPRSGIVVKKYIEEGSVVAGARSSVASAGNGVTLVEIADVSRMNVVVNIDETDIARIEVGQEVDVTVDAFADELFIGKVTKIAPQTISEQNVTTIPVTVEIEAPDLRLKPGMNATCEFVTARRSDVLTVPNAAVKQGEQGAVVTVIEHGKPTARPVRTGLSDNDRTEIIDGVTEGETIVTAMQDPTRKAPGGMMGPGGGMPGGGGQGGQQGAGRRMMRPF